ncbi:MAG: hypothetical protein CM1200mP27_10260 [Chloroflexota bacterium]|nr:MAG: hypothetical protein CM1200mP27_10260 [Chloroflexota bacterium]
MESPVPKAAAMIRVLIIIPKRMSIVCDLRLGMLRRASLSITRLRNATPPTPATIGRKTANRATHYDVHIQAEKFFHVRPGS